MKRLWLILLIVSCTTAPKINYEGNVNDEGKYHGKGVITYSNGEKWQGDWKEGEPFNGLGTLIWPSGEKYSGEYKDGKPFNGKGIYIWPTGEKYVGVFRDGQRNNTGTYTWPSAEKYVGEFENGESDGKGALLKVNGEIKSRIMDNETLQTQWAIEAVDNLLKNKHHKFKGLNYFFPSFFAPKNDIAELPPPPNILTNIVVVNFIGNNISDGEVKALMDRLRTELIKTKHFKVIESELTEEILNSQGLQQSGCTTDKCMVQVGRLIGVQKVIGGSISKVDYIYSVSARIINVETGKIERSEVYDQIGEIGQLLTNGLRMVAIGLIK